MSECVCEGRGVWPPGGYLLLRIPGPEREVKLIKLPIRAVSATLI